MGTEPDHNATSLPSEDCLTNIKYHLILSNGFHLSQEHFNIFQGNILQQTSEQPFIRPSSLFIIGSQEVKKRNRNLFWGLLLSFLLAVVITSENYRDPITYNNTLLWSILAFLVLANLVNYVRYVRYLRLIRKHKVEIGTNKITFYTGNNKSELDISSISIMQMYRNSNSLQHIQLRLKNNRGIRLEGYDQLESMANLIADQLQPEQVIQRKVLFA